MGSNPCRGSSLLGIAHPIEGKLFQVQGVFGKRRSLEVRIMKQVGLWPWFMFYVYILERTSFNICFVLRVM